MNARFAVLVGLTLVCVTGFAGATDAVAACPNEALRSEARSTLLPQCRAYELVSSVDTADSGVLAFAGAAPGGQAAEFISPGGFAGPQSNYGFNYYIARRNSDSWGTSSIGLPATLGATVIGTATSSDLTKQLVRGQFLTGERAGYDGLFLSEDLAAASSLSFGAVVEYDNIPTAISKFGNGHEGHYEPVDESPDFSHVLVPSNVGETFEEPKLYEISGVGGPNEALELVSLGPEGTPIIAVAGSGKRYGGSLFHAISNNGARVFFTKYDKEVTGPSYVRVDGKETLLLSGLFQGASEDGEKVFIKGAGGALVMDEIDSEPGHAAITGEVPVSQGASALYVRSSDDGSHVYFVSKSVLFEKPKNEYGEEAKASEWNLYVYDTVTKETAFIARTLPGGSESDIEEAAHVEAQVNGCPSRELGETEEQGCEGGRFFVFTSEAKLTPDDTASGQQVFEYDARTRQLTRISVGEWGYDENGNGGSGGATIAAPEFGDPGLEVQAGLFEDNTRAVSDDGSTVVFTATRLLSPRALNGQPDIYEWHEGQIGIISTGHSPAADEQAVITPSGRDIFFTSTEGILPQDSDGLKSLYDARVGGGFPAPPVPAGGCNGDSCQGPPSVPELLGPPASATFSGPGNLKPPADTAPKPAPRRCGKGNVKRRGRCVKGKKKHGAANAGRKGA